MQPRLFPGYHCPMAHIHPTAIVTGDCNLADDVEIGPSCVLTGPITLEAGVRLIGHAYLTGPLTIGKGTLVYPFACIGYPGQDAKFTPGDPTAGIVIGPDCNIREYATIHAATKPDVPTRVGARVYMMVHAHVGHDGFVGDDAVLVNNTALGGHAQVHAGAILGGGALIHQYNRVGRLAMVAGLAQIAADIPPFCMAAMRSRLVGINVIGLRRAGFPREHITQIKSAYREILDDPPPKSEVIEQLKARAGECPPLLEMAEFIEQAARPIAPGLAITPSELKPTLKRLRQELQTSSLPNE